jgi:hypothetical protein
VGVEQAKRTPRGVLFKGLVTASTLGFWLEKLGTGARRERDNTISVSGDNVFVQVATSTKVDCVLAGTVTARRVGDGERLVALSAFFSGNLKEGHNGLS